jgi:hypothetical protein
MSPFLSPFVPADGPNSTRWAGSGRGAAVDAVGRAWLTENVKRSDINRNIAEAREFFGEHAFVLPPSAFWTPERWKMKGK